MHRRRFASSVLLLGVLAWTGCRHTGPVAFEPVRTFVNPVYEGADPFVHRHTDGTYYFVQSEGDRGIAVWKSERLTDKGVKRVVWLPPKTGWNTSEIWAPELHYLNGKWYIYYAADAGENKDHRMGVLESATDDPQGAYVDRGQLYTGDDIQGRTNNRWAIDGTPLELGGRLYFLWSGWEDTRDEQWLYIAEMENPWTIKTNRVRLADNDEYLWERVSERADERGLHEGPQVLRQGDRVHVLYSVSGSWQPTYKLARLSLKPGADPMKPESWVKSDRPVFTGTDRVHGVGHASFTRSPDDTEDWIVYHTKLDTLPGWRRAVHLQPFTWGAEGPVFGEPVAAGVPLPLPSGETPNRPGASFSDAFADGDWDDWVYYGYNRFIGVQEEALSIDSAPGPDRPNSFPSAEKALVRGHDWSDFSLSADVNVVRGDREAGLLFRTTHPAIGFDAWKGYFAGIRPGEDVVVLGRSDGTRFTEIARAPMPVENDVWYELTVLANGPRIEVHVNGEPRLQARDATHSAGMAGVRSHEVHALFDDVEITAAQPGR